MEYRSLFSLTIRHDYYPGGLCPDIAGVPTPECARLLQGHRLLWRENEHGFQVLSGLDKAGMPFLPLPKSAIFRFHLYVNNPAFFNFTDLFASYGGKAVSKPVFFNTPDNPVLQVREPGAGQALPRDCFGAVDIQVHNPAVFNDFAKNASSNHVEIHFQASQYFWKYCLTSEKALTNTSIAFAQNKVLYDATSQVVVEKIDDLQKELAAIDKKLLNEADKNTRDMLTAKKNGVQKFIEEVKALGTAIDPDKCFYFFSEQKIPCRKKHREYPSLEISIPDSPNRFKLFLPAPTGDIDSVQLIRV